MPDIVPKAWFETWREPREFFREADECMGQFEPDHILGMSGAQHLFDAYVSGLFARIWNDHRHCEIRLVSGNFPDAELKDEVQTLDLEVTLADRRDRRMVDEHRRWRQLRELGERTVEPVNHARDREYAIEAVPRVCGNKVEKYLGSRKSNRRIEVDLLVYVNFSTLLGPVLSDQEMVALTQPWGGNFSAIWLLCGARIFRAWPSEFSLVATSDPIH